MNLSKILIISIGIFGLNGCSDNIPKTSGDYAFKNVTVIPMDSEKTLANQTVVVEGGKIKLIAQTESISLDGDVKIIDGSGKYLIPGLSDMHVHIWSEQEPPLYVANGVTLVRNMWGETFTLKIRDDINSGNILGPTIITGGRIVDGAPRMWDGSEEIKTEEEARAIVRAHKSAGYDFIKVYSSLTPELFDIIADEAKAQNIPFSGHVPMSVTLEHAMRSGMTTIEHLTGFKEATYKEGVDFGKGFFSKERMDIGSKLNSGELSFDDIFDPSKTKTMAAIATETGVWNVPTLIVIDKIFLTRKEADVQFSRPEIKYIVPAIQSMWNPDNDFRRKNTTDEQLKAMQGFFQREVDTVTTLHEAGANIMSGTDAPNPYVFHGFSLHEELALFVKAGMTPYEALRTSTINPAKFLNAVGEFGTITVGARADMVLLDANPLEDISNAQMRSGVMLRGRWLPEAELQKALEVVAKEAPKGPSTLNLDEIQK